MTRGHARLPLLLVVAIAGCAVGTPPMPVVDGGRPRDGGTSSDGGSMRDGGSMVDGGSPRDSGSIDAGRDAGEGDAERDGGVDGGRDVDAAADAGIDAAVDAGCGISTGHTITLDGTDDLTEFPTSQRVMPGAELAPTDVAAITWDSDFIYVAMTSEAFTDEFKPLHVYLQLGASLGAATAAMGKEYGGNTPWLPFSPTHLIAVRRRNAGAVGGPYNAVYLPSAGWTTVGLALIDGTHVFASSDGRTLSVRVPWSALTGCPTRARLAAHVVYDPPGSANEWKDVVPSGHMPWMMSGSGFLEIDLSMDPSSSGWITR